MNPYVLLLAIAMGLGLFGTGVRIGIKWERNDTLAAVAVAQDTAIKAANAATAAEVERSLARAKADESARAKAREIRHKGELDALKKSRTECARDGESMGLLLDAIDAANGNQTTTPKGVPDAVRPDGKAAGWLGTLGSKLGVSGGGSIRPVPSTTR